LRCYGVDVTEDPLAGVLCEARLEVSALRYSGGVGLHGRSALLRLQSDERLIAVVRRGNPAGFEVLVSRYQSRLLAFCRHLLGSREDAEDVLQEVLAASFNAILADDRPINVRPWLYRIARNRCLNHLRRIQAVGVDSMDVHLSDHGASTADKVHRLEEFRMLVGDIHELPETQKTALVLREMDALSYEQISEAMETTVPSVKSLLVRARMSLAEAAEARMLSCDDVRMELAEIAEGLQRRPGALVRRHLRACKRCSNFQVQLKETNKALTAVLPIGPLVLLKKLVLTHVGHSAGASASAGAGSSGAAGPAAAISTTAAAGAAVGPSAGGLLSAGMGALATKAAAGLAAAALVTAGAVEVSHAPRRSARPAASSPTPVSHAAVQYTPVVHHAVVAAIAIHHPVAKAKHPPAAKPAKTTATTKTTRTDPTKRHDKNNATPTKTTTTAPTTAAPAPGRTQTQSQTTVLPSSQPSGSTSDESTTPATSTTDSSGTTTTPDSGSGGGTETVTTGTTGTTTTTDTTSTGGSAPQSSDSSGTGSSAG
jgi:RNA polymerase sigma factor (sigma-70 family)